jgi:transcriptional regulator with XRE-family HTH domain
MASALQPICACTINPVKNTSAAQTGRRVDPEEQAVKALRQLRLSRSWSQQEVAARMMAYGYDFHQTTIAKIEAAQRPLRVRELADFAALYGVEVQELVYGPTRALPEVDLEIEDVTAQLGQAQAIAARATQEVQAIQAAARDAETAQQAALAAVAVLNGRLDALMANRDKLRRWNPSSSTSLEEAGNEDGLNAPGPEAAAIASTAEDNPYVLRLLLGSNFRRLREAKRITAEQASEIFHWPISKITRFELGRTGVKKRDITDLLALYGVTDDQERDQWLNLAQRANSPNWWQVYSDILPNWFEPYIGLEAAATEIKVFEARQIPDLLQTDDYSHVLISQNYKRYTSKEIDRRVQLRAARTERVLERPNAPYLQVILDETVLRRQVGDETVMRDELRHLTEIAMRPNVDIRVLPLTAATHSADGSFRILQFGETDLPEVVYIEQLTSALYLDRSQEVDAYMKVMNQLTGSVLSKTESVSFLLRLLVA